MFYKLLESVCRRSPQFKTQADQLDALFTTGDLFDLPFSSVPVLLRDRSFYKSYTSACASWCKSVVKVLSDLPADNSDSATRILDGVAAALLGRVQWLSAWIEFETSIASEVHDSACTSSRGQAAGATPTSFSNSGGLQLLLLVDLSPAVAAVIERLKSAALLPETVPDEGRAYTCVNDTTSHSCSTQSPKSSSSSSKSSQRNPPLASTGLTSSPPAAATKEDFPTSPLQQAVNVGLRLVAILEDWHEKVANAADAAKQAADAFKDLPAPAVAPGKQPEAAAASRPVLHVAGSTGCEVPRWLAKLPQQGLPGALAEQLQRMDSEWPVEVLEACLSEATEQGEGMRCESACQQQLQQVLGTPVACASCMEGVRRRCLGDVLQLINTLLDEVPLPLGCNNPACVNLEGDSEAAASHRACNGCKVACYCSTKCQKAHWKRHKSVCQRLQQQVQPT